MQLKSKLRILVLGILLVSMLVPLFVTVYSIRSDAERTLSRFRNEEMTRAKDQARDFVGLAWSHLQDSYSDEAGKNYLEREFGQPMKNVVFTIERLLGSHADLIRNGVVPAEKARSEILASLREMRFFNGAACVWVQDEGKPFPRMVMNPLFPALEGKVLDDPSFNCAGNRADNVFLVADGEGRKPEGGFIDYLWPKPMPDGSMVPNLPREAYVKHFKDWGWVVGIGIWVDDAIQNSIEGLRDDLSKLKFGGGANGFLVVDIHGMVKVHDQPELIGKNLASDSAHPEVASILNIGLSASGEGYFEHNPVSPKTGEVSHRLGFAKTFEPLGWVVATSLTIDFIEREVEWRREKLDTNLWWIIAFITVFYAGLITLAAKLLTVVLGVYKNSDPDNPVPLAFLNGEAGPVSASASGTPASSSPSGGEKQNLNLNAMLAGVDHLAKGVEELRRAVNGRDLPQSRTR